MAHEQRVRYSELIDKKMRAALVTVDSGAMPVFNTRYEGDPKAGAVKIPVRDAEVKTGDYHKVNGIDLTTGDTTYLTVTDFNDKAVNELIDGYDAAAVPANLVADRLDSAGYAMSSLLDTDGIATLEAEGTVAANTTPLTPATVYAAVVAARTALSKVNVPTSGRFMIVSPDTYALMLSDTNNFIRQGDMSQTLVEQGYIGMMAGFAIKESNNLDPTTEFIAGHADWCTRIKEWTVEPSVNDLKDGKHIGASAVQGRYVYKHKVTKSVAVYVKTKA